MWPKTGSTITNRLPCRSDLENHYKENQNGSPKKNFEEVSLPRTKNDRSNDGGQSDNGSDVEVQHCSFLLDQHLFKTFLVGQNSSSRI